MRMTLYSLSRARARRIKGERATEPDGVADGTREREERGEEGRRARASGGRDSLSLSLSLSLVCLLSVN